MGLAVVIVKLFSDSLERQLQLGDVPYNWEQANFRNGQKEDLKNCRFIQPHLRLWEGTGANPSQVFGEPVVAG